MASNMKVFFFHLILPPILYRIITFLSLQHFLDEKRYTNYEGIKKMFIGSKTKEFMLEALIIFLYNEIMSSKMKEIIALIESITDH